MEGIGRTNEAENVATAKVHLVVKDEACTAIGKWVLSSSIHLWKVTATRASKVGDYTFYFCVNLTEAILSSANSVGEDSLYCCYKLTNIRLPNETPTGPYLFALCYDLRHITVHPNVDIDKDAFSRSLSFEVLATSAGVESDTGEK